MRKFLVDYWALICVVGGGLIAWGAFSARLDAAEEAIGSMATDHDTLTTIKADLSNVSKKVDLIDKKIDRLTERAQ